MFTKLLKHEFKSQWGVFTVLSLATLGASILDALLTGLSLYLLDSKNDELLSDTISLIASPLQTFSTIFIIIYIPIIWFLLINRFYKHHFSDEGYLTFTLPASTHSILLANLLNTALWLILSFIVIRISYDIQSLPYDLYHNDLWDTIISPYEPTLDEILHDIMMTVSVGTYALILPTLSITIGALVAKKHKLLAAFGIGYGINTAVSIVLGMITIYSLVSDELLNSGILDGEYTYNYLSISNIISFAIYFGIAIGGYFLMHYLIDKKLNLP